jgi:hypothetical protein
MKIVIAGSRSIINYDLLEFAIYRSKFVNITEVISGKASGVDFLGEQWARKNNIPIIEFPAKWNLLGKRAGYERNKEMAQYCDGAIILWNGISNGTKNMVENLEKLYKPYYRLIFNEMYYG